MAKKRKRRSFHLTHDKKKGDWKLFEAGSKRTMRRFKNKEEGVKVSAEIVRKKGNTQLKIHKVDGKIQEERTYGNDPKKSKG